MKKYLLATACIFALVNSGCSRQIGHQFDATSVNLLQPGVSTEDDAIAMFGKPNSVSNKDDGSQLLQWMYSRGTLVGGSGAHAAILFGPDHKMVRVVHVFELR